MGEFASCSWPIWHVDDFSTCFQRDYLKVIFPLTIVSLSLLRLLIGSLRRVVRLKRGHGYESLPAVDSSHGRTEVPATELPVAEELTPDGSDDGSSDAGLEIHGGGTRHLAPLARTTTKDSVVQADRPPAQTLSVAVEELAICGLVAVNALALIYGSFDAQDEGAGGGRGKQRPRLAAATGLAVWLYVLVLTTLRLFLGKTRWRVPHLWNHTATIYGFMWLFILVVFRSVFVHPSSRLTQVLVIVEFSLTTLLFLMAITTRKGNKTVMMEWEDGIEPSKEPLASLLSLATFAWVDEIIWKGHKQPYEMNAIWNLVPKDKAAAVLADYRQLRKTTSLALHLLKYFKGMVAAMCAWAFFSGFFTFAPTLLLRAILQYVEDPAAAPRNVLWLYVILLPISDLVRSVADGMALWTGRKACIKIRAIMIGEIYAKALRRKAATSKDTDLGSKKKKADVSEAKEGRLGKIKRLLGMKKKDDKKPAQADASAASDAAKDKKDGAPDEQANLGTIINLMSVDSFKIAEITAYLHFLLAAAPTQLTVAIVLLWQVMGLSAIPGVVVIFLLFPVNYALAKGFNSTQKTIMAATDKRIHTTNEILQNIRIIKYFAWEQRFSAIVDEKRKAELKALRMRYLIWAVAVAIWNTVPVVITFFSFLVYTLVEKKPLYPSVAFTAISLFMLLRVPLDQFSDMLAHVQESRVSIDRVDEFLNEEETEKYEQLGEDNIDETGKRVIGFRDATFIWGGKNVVAQDGSMAFRLLDLNVDFKVGKLNVIAGPTGSGKTSMLMALLGEMTLIKGRVFCPGGRSREDVRPDPETGLAETCAYVAQQAWLVNASIKENILFAAPFDEQRYKDVLVACALEHDLEILDNGDETLVGEKGITLSGGQKQRISLARAVYSNSKHILLDDCLSAVDSHTAQWIFSTCICGPLMKGRTCILVSHNIALTVPTADYVVVMENGRVATQGTAKDVIASGKLGEEVQKALSPSANVSQVPSRVPSSVGESSGETLLNSQASENDGAGAAKKVKKEKQKMDAMEESKAIGSVKWPVMKLYLSAMGPWWFWVVAVLVFGVQQLSGVASNIWIKEWASQYTADVSKIEFNANSLHAFGKSISPTYFANIALYAKGSKSVGNETVAMATTSLPADEVNVQYYLTVLALIGIGGAIVAFVRDLWLFLGSLTASWKIHNWLMKSVTRARFKFFDVTPLGQIMNRFSKDLEAVDQEVAPIAIGVMSCAFAIVVTVVLIAFITPGFLIAGVFITLLYFFVGKYYLEASRDLKRLESVQRSPLFQQFGETLSGVTTIRAYGDERRFIRDNLQRINAQARPFIYLWACNRWLAFRTDLLGDLVAFFAGVFVIFSIGRIDAGWAGVSLSYAIGFTENILWLVRLYAMNEQNMNSVERIKEYLDVEQEAEAIVEKNRPEPNWPANGSVEFINYTTRYRKELDPVLRNVSFRIEPRQKIGIVGRTGAGKSSLALAIFRALEADEGKILIDDVDISLIGLQDLRERITIVPQEPTLFMGTIRSNLDPFSLYTDEELFEALRRVQLIAPGELEANRLAAASAPVPQPPPLIDIQDTDGAANGGSNGTAAEPLATNKNIFLDLSSPVSESGSNLSQGQRQLLCLARAMLRKPSVLVMDEATASIDYATDAKIQKTIRELASSTIITIAHRLQTIVDYDRVLVLDKGCVVEFGHPYELITKSGDGEGGRSAFRAMCETSGDLESLTKAAKKAWDAGRLVDV